MLIVRAAVSGPMLCSSLVFFAVPALSPPPPELLEDVEVPTGALFVVELPAPSL